MTTPEHPRHWPRRRTVALIGGGHAHVQILRRWAMDPPPDARLVVILDQPVAVYSGMVPGFVAGDYHLEELEIDVVPLARRAGAGVVLSRAIDLDPVRREVALEGRPPIRFDIASIDVGSTVRGLDLPGVREHALATRPIGHFVRSLDAHCQRLRELERAARIAIVGGGAAGSEIALTLRARLRSQGLDPEISLVTAEEHVLKGASSALRKRLNRELDRAGIERLPCSRVVSVAKDGVLVRSTADPAKSEPVHRSADLVVWATGAAPTTFPNHSLHDERRARLAQDDAGFLEVRDTLQAVGFDDIFAVGDCARLVNHRWVPRAGVYAVRQGPVLDHNLRAALAGRALRGYRPQRDFLSLLNLGEGRALGGKWGLALAGRAVLRLKDVIDRRFMSRFQVLAPDGEPKPALESLGAMTDEEDAEEMTCGGCAAKLGALPLDAALALLPSAPADESVLLGLEARDDVAATRLPTGGILLHNIDVIRAFCDDPYLVGRVAASNALSDVYAKGGIPRHTQAIIGLPEQAPDLAQEMLFQALSGLRATLDQAGVTLLGGHTTIGDELTVGLAVTGDGGSEKDLLRQSGAEPGDTLLMTQPIGTGVILAADMQGLARGEWLEETHAWMQRTNEVAGRLAREHGVHASTDITGFGLAGHCLSLLEASDLCAELDRGWVRLLPGARGLWERGLRSTAHPQNREAFIDRTAGANPLDEAWLFDPQTAGGLLLAVEPSEVDGLRRAFAMNGEPEPLAIGKISAGSSGRRSGGVIEVVGSSVE